MSTLQALDSPDPGPLIQSLKTSLAALAHKAPTTLKWVPAHVSLSGNEHADRLAKEGSQLSQPDNPVTYEEAKTLLSSSFRARWSLRNQGYNPRQDPIRALERHQQTTIFRLRTGHCGLRAHLKRIGVAPSAQCECGQADQTPAHILQECPLLDEQRRQSWPGGVDLDTKLWGTVDDLRRTASFAASLEIRL